MASQLAILGGEAVRKQPFSRWPAFGQPEEQALLRALRSGKWGKLDGQEVAEFEKRFAAEHDTRHGIGVVNGTVSLRIGLMAAGVGAEDEVIVPPYTFLATASAVIEANAVPVFADIDLDTFNISPAAIEAAITPRTRAIIPVHMAGLPADMDAIMAIARRHKLLVIEDAAHAHGAVWKGRKAGSIGDMGSFSFQSSKNLTSGEGGIIITNDDELAEQCRSVHNCGRIAGGPWYEHHVISANYRLGEFQGAILNAQLDRLAEQTATRDRNGLYLAERLAQIPGVHPQKRTADCGRCSYHLFLMRIDGEAFGAPRQAVIAAMKAEGVPLQAGYVMPLYHQPLFVNKAFGPYIPQAAARLDYKNVSCPNCDKICYQQGAWLEQSIMLGSQQDMDDICRAFMKVHDARRSLSDWAASQSV